MSKAYYDETTGRIIIRGLRAKPGQMDFKFRNFSGEKTDTNQMGSRNFCVIISEEDKIAIEEALVKADKHLNIKEYNGEYYFKINAKFGKYPPRICKKKKLPNGRDLLTEIEEENLKSLDRMLISEADLSCSPTFLVKNRNWTCYLNVFTFVPLVDPLEEELETIVTGYPTEDDDDDVPFEE